MAKQTWSSLDPCHQCILTPAPRLGGFFNALVLCNGDIFHTPWESDWPAAHQYHINFKEVLALEPAVIRWGHLWKNRKIVVHTDNKAAESIINKGSSTEPFVMASLRRVFWLSAIHNFRIFAVHIPGSENKLADAASRLHEPRGRDRMAAELSVINENILHSLHRSETHPGGNPGQKNGGIQRPGIRHQHQDVLQNTQADIHSVLSGAGIPCCARNHKHNCSICFIPRRVPPVQLNKTIPEHCAYNAPGKQPPEPTHRKLPPDKHSTGHTPQAGGLVKVEAAHLPEPPKTNPRSVGPSLPPRRTSMGPCPSNVLWATAKSQRPAKITHGI